jgi:hypothetical protein
LGWAVAREGAGNSQIIVPKQLSARLLSIFCLMLSAMAICERYVWRLNAAAPTASKPARGRPK